MHTALVLRHATDCQRNDRLNAQLAFAERLCDFHPEQAVAWRAAISAARMTWAANPDTATALSAAELALTPIAAAAKAHTIHCAGHAHIDMNWMWGWPETVATTLDTFRTVLRLMEEFPEFVFGQSQASVYRIVEEHEPEMLERIKVRVREGRWEVVAAHWVEGDRNLAGGEALCRHLLETRTYINELFGLTPEQVPVDWSPDTFGHANTLPGIDVRGAAKFLYCCRTGDLTRPPVFWWESPDGSRQLVHREIAWYINAPGPEHATKFLLDFRAATELKEWLLVYGVGDHGGGPTRRDLRRIIDMNSWPCFPNFRFARVDAFFAKLEKEGARWPVLAHELNCEFTGCYTSQSAIKRANRIGETACNLADAASALAHQLTGRGVRKQRLSQAWRDVLFSHFHDILPGSGVTDTRTFCQGQSQIIQAVTGQERQQSLRAIAERIDTTFAGPAKADPEASETTGRGLGAGQGRMFDGGLSRAALIGDGPRPAVVFNPTAWPRTELVTLSVWDGDADSLAGHVRDRAYTIVASDGKLLAPQKVGSGHFWGHDFVDLTVPVEVPAFGWAAVAVREEVPPVTSAVVELLIDEDGGHGHRSPNPAGLLRLRNEHMEIVIDRRNGGLARIVDRATGADLIPRDAGFGRPEVQIERPIGMSAWQLGDPRGEPLEPLLIEQVVVERGPWRAVVTQRFRHHDSTIAVSYLLAAGARRVEIASEVRWLEQGDQQLGIARLQMRFPTAAVGGAARYETPFGAVSRPHLDGREVPALRWAAVTTAQSSLVLLNDGKHGHSLDAKGTLRVSLIRSSYDPDPLPELADHRIRLAIVALAGTVSDADCTRWACEHDQPLAPVPTPVHTGTLPPRTELMNCANADVVVHQVKPAADGDGLILRLAQHGSVPIMATVTCTSALGKIAEVESCDILERKEATLTTANNGFTVAAAPSAPVTIRLRFASQSLREESGPV